MRGPAIRQLRFLLFVARDRRRGSPASSRAIGCPRRTSRGRRVVRSFGATTIGLGYGAALCASGLRCAVVAGVAARARCSSRGRVADARQRVRVLARLRGRAASRCGRSTSRCSASSRSSLPSRSLVVGCQPRRQRVGRGGRAPVDARRSGALRGDAARRAHGHRVAAPAGDGAAPAAALASACATAARIACPCGRAACAVLLRWPASRVARLVVLGAVAGSRRHAARGTERRRSSSSSGLALYIAALDAVEPLAQEVDHPTRRNAVPIDDGRDRAASCARWPSWRWSWSASSRSSRLGRRARRRTAGRDRRRLRAARRARRRRRCGDQRRRRSSEPERRRRHVEPDAARGGRDAHRVPHGLAAGHGDHRRRAGARRSNRGAPRRASGARSRCSRPAAVLLSRSSSCADGSVSASECMRGGAPRWTWRCRHERVAGHRRRALWKGRSRRWLIPCSRRAEHRSRTATSWPSHPSTSRCRAASWSRSSVTTARASRRSCASPPVLLEPVERVDRDRRRRPRAARRPGPRPASSPTTPCCTTTSACASTSRTWPRCTASTPVPTSSTRSPSGSVSCRAPTTSRPASAAGLRQKTSIALGIARPFELLLVDEPFVGLDATGKTALLELFDELHGDGPHGHRRHPRRELRRARDALRRVARR